MLKLGGLYEKLNDRENAVNAYLQFVNDERSINDKNSRISPYIYLANYYIDKKCYEEATTYAHKVLEYSETNQEAKSILKTIASSRVKQEDDLHNATMELEGDEQDLVLDDSGELDMEITME
jgi:tetratricopeptide (TPR) repeat protein